MRSLLVDGANVVGSRPDGWWRDRAGAARRLADRLGAADVGRLPADEVVLVLEGRARSGVPEIHHGRLGVVHAAGSGDDALVTLARERTARGDTVCAVSADRALAARLRAVGAEVVGPGWLLDRLAPAADRPRTAAVVVGYGSRRPDGLDDWLAHVHAVLDHHLGALPALRPAETVHSTVIGLDPVAPLEPGREAEQLAARVDLPGLLDCLREDLAIPLRLRLSGFEDRDHGLTSRGERLHARSLVADRGQVVAVGWPVDSSGRPSRRLDALRRRLEEHGARHRYPLHGGAQDPDAHLVVAESSPPDPVALAAARRALAGQVHEVVVGLPHLAVVCYSDPTLPLAATTVLDVEDLTG